MIGTLQLDKFRGFDGYELTDLKRVNLLVGKNNCGKTSILEAIHLLVSGGDPLVLRRSANRRGEVSETGTASGREWGPDISHFFFGHRFAPGISFCLSSGDRYGEVSVAVHSAPLEDQYQSSLFRDYMDQPLPLVLQIVLKKEGNTLKNLPVIPVTENGALLNLRPLQFRRSWSEILPARPPVQFVTPDSLDLVPMRTMWDRVLTEGRESEVINAIKILENDLNSIHFLTSAVSRTRSGRGPACCWDFEGAAVGYPSAAMGMECGGFSHSRFHSSKRQKGSCWSMRSIRGCTGPSWKTCGD